MSMFVTQFGRQGFADGSIDWDTNNFRADLLRLDGTLQDTAVKAITGITNASPAVYTSAAHGFTNGQIVCVRGVLGAVGANQIGKVANVAANTFTLQTLSAESLDVGTPGAYTSGGVAINLSLFQNRQDVDAASVHGATAVGAAGGPAAPGATRTATNGILTCSNGNMAWLQVPDLAGGQVHCYALCKDNGASATDRSVFYYDGRISVVCASAAAGAATSVAVESLPGPIASGTAIAFSNGVIATLTAPALKGARTLTVAALSAGIAAGHVGEAALGVAQNFPKTTNGGDITLTIDAIEGLFTL
jgi:hypothetical protein